MMKTHVIGVIVDARGHSIAEPGIRREKEKH